MTANQQQRLALFPTRMTLNTVKQREKGAVKGHALLKRKSDALTARFRTILTRIHTAKQLAAEKLKDAAFALTEARFAFSGGGGQGDNLHFLIKEQSANQQHFHVRVQVDNVSGVGLPVFEGVYEGGGRSPGGLSPGLLSPSNTTLNNNNNPHDNQQHTPFELTGLARGGQALAKARQAHQLALQALLDLASWQTAFFLLDDVIRTVNRRVNALEHVLIPKLTNTVNYISGELDEQDREEFYRLKKIQGKNKEKRETMCDDHPNTDLSDLAVQVKDMLSLQDDGIPSLF